MLRVIAGTPAESTELVRSYVQLGVPVAQIRSATFKDWMQIPLDDLLETTIIVEFSTTIPGTWQILQELRAKLPNENISCLFHGSPTEAVRVGLEERASKIPVNLLTASAANLKEKNEKLHGTVKHLIPPPPVVVAAEAAA